MGLNDYLNKAKGALKGDRGQRLMDKAEDAASRATDGRYDDKIQKAREAADKAINDEDGRGDTGR